MEDPRGAAELPGDACSGGATTAAATTTAAAAVVGRRDEKVAELPRARHAASRQIHRRLQRACAPRRSSSSSGRAAPVVGVATPPPKSRGSSLRRPCCPCSSFGSRRRRITPRFEVGPGRGQVRRPRRLRAVGRRRWLLLLLLEHQPRRRRRRDSSARARTRPRDPSPCDPPLFACCGRTVCPKGGLTEDEKLPSPETAGAAHNQRREGARSVAAVTAPAQAHHTLGHGTSRAIAC